MLLNFKLDDITRHRVCKQVYPHNEIEQSNVLYRTIDDRPDRRASTTIKGIDEIP